MAFTRRDFLRRSAVGFAALALPSVGARGARAAGADRVVVSLFLRGGADGLSLVVPHGDPHYASRRPSLAVAPGDAIDLDGFFGLHPQLAPLHPLYTGGQLALLHAVAGPDTSRSHFEAQDSVDRGAAPGSGVTSGWLNRYLQSLGGGGSFAGVSLGYAKAPSLVGPAPSLALHGLRSLRIDGWWPSDRRAALEAMYDGVAGTLLGRSASEAFDAMDAIAAVPPSTATGYPDGELGRTLRDAAALVKARIGVRVVAVSHGGWDTHDGQNGELPGSAAELAQALAAFHADLGADADRTLVLAMSEFGRTVDENGSAGTDHGHAGVMMALGGGVAGGRVIVRGAWPGLGPGRLHDDRDLAATADFRDVFGEVLERHLGVSDARPVLPGFAVDPRNRPGLYL